jgi:hypothetical protein
VRGARKKKLKWLEVCGMRYEEEKDFSDIGFPRTSDPIPRACLIPLLGGWGVKTLL